MLLHNTFRALSPSLSLALTRTHAHTHSRQTHMFQHFVYAPLNWIFGKQTWFGRRGRKVESKRGRDSERGQRGAEREEARFGSRVHGAKAVRAHFAMVREPRSLFAQRRKLERICDGREIKRERRPQMFGMCDAPNPSLSWPPPRKRCRAKPTVQDGDRVNSRELLTKSPHREVFGLCHYRPYFSGASEGHVTNLPEQHDPRRPTPTGTSDSHHELRHSTVTSFWEKKQNFFLMIF